MYTILHYSDETKHQSENLFDMLTMADKLGPGYYVHDSDIDGSGSTLRTWEDHDAIEDAEYDARKAEEERVEREEIETYISKGRCFRCQGQYLRLYKGECHDCIGDMLPDGHEDTMAMKMLKETR